MGAPTFPSLYNPAIELTPIQNSAPVQAAGYYIPLDGPRVLFVFTFYWTLAFQIPVFAICAIWACLCLTAKREEAQDEIELRDLRSGKQRRTQNRPERLAFSVIILGTFMSLSLLGTLVSSAVVSLMLFGLFRAGGFFMSTWIPFLGALFSVGVGALRYFIFQPTLFASSQGDYSVWPSVIEII